MTLEEFKTILYKLENVMYGHNYEVIFGIDIFENCPDIEEFKIRLKKTYQKSKPETVVPISLTLADFWEEINFGLTYRGDNSAGLVLDSKRQKEFEVLEKEYKDFIGQHITDATKIYSYPDVAGIPGYPVFWDYRFIAQSGNNNCLFIYASSSD